jgi:hypothetical protein
MSCAERAYLGRRDRNPETPGRFTTPTPVTIEVITASPGGGTFTTSGAGLCPSGTTTDQEFGTGGQSGLLANFHDLKTFTCADGSGTFTANVQAQLIFGFPADSFTWNILSGTGAYTNLRGSGNGVGDEQPTAIDDHFAGARPRRTYGYAPHSSPPFCTVIAAGWEAVRACRIGRSAGGWMVWRWAPR